MTRNNVPRRALAVIFSIVIIAASAFGQESSPDDSLSLLFELIQKLQEGSAAPPAAQGPPLWGETVRFQVSDGSLSSVISLNNRRAKNITRQLLESVQQDCANFDVAREGLRRQVQNIKSDLLTRLQEHGVQKSDGMWDVTRERGTAAAFIARALLTLSRNNWEVTYKHIADNSGTCISCQRKHFLFIEDSRIAALEKEFGSKRRADYVLESIEDAIACLESALRGFAKRENDAGFKKRFDDRFEDWIGDANPENIAEKQAQIQIMCNSLSEKAKNPAEFFQNVLSEKHVNSLKEKFLIEAKEANTEIDVNKKIANYINSVAGAYATYGNSSEDIILLFPKYFQKPDEAKNVILHEESHDSIGLEDVNGWISKVGGYLNLLDGEPINPDGEKNYLKPVVWLLDEDKAKRDTSSMEFFLNAVCGMQ